jgi:hypothetical protein
MTSEDPELAAQVFRLPQEPEPYTRGESIARSRRGMVEEMVFDAKLLGDRLRRGEYAEDRREVTLTLGRTLIRLHELGVHRKAGYRRWRDWVDAELPFTGRMASRYMKAATEWDQGARGSSLREIAGEAQTERITPGEVSRRILADDAFTIDVIEDEHAYQRIVELHDLMKRGKRRPQKTTEIAADLNRIRKMMFLATRKVAKVTKAVEAGQATMEQDDWKRIERAQKQVTEGCSALEFAIDRLEMTFRSVWG